MSDTVSRRKTKHLRVIPSKKEQVVQLKDGQYMTTKDEVIQFGLKYLEGVGSQSVCQVCIPHGGSCCIGCLNLNREEGCQQRNTSCTAGLCGFLKLILHEAGLLREWDRFWDQIPGKGFRKDFTPSDIPIKKWLEIPDIQRLSEAFAKDLSEYVKKQKQPGYIIRLNNELDFYLTRLFQYKEPEMLRKAEKKLKKTNEGFSPFSFSKRKNGQHTVTISM
ncbi:hypothetical protein [Laceyella putida]|uniref:DNA mismatch repair protein n=1 Tax=Laceyella putida TaxID=110101 RepID=A0ABW2RQ06_9BACL